MESSTTVATLHFINDVKTVFVSYVYVCKCMCLCHRIVLNICLVWCICTHLTLLFLLISSQYMSFSIIIIIRLFWPLYLLYCCVFTACLHFLYVLENDLLLFVAVAFYLLLSICSMNICILYFLEQWHQYLYNTLRFSFLLLTQNASFLMVKYSHSIFIAENLQIL